MIKPVQPPAAAAAASNMFPCELCCLKKMTGDYTEEAFFPVVFSGIALQQLDLAFHLWTILRQSIDRTILSVRTFFHLATSYHTMNYLSFESLSFKDFYLSLSFLKKLFDSSLLYCILLS